MIKAICFDLDETLLDFGHVNRDAIFQARARRSYAFLTARGCALPSFEDFCRKQRSAFRWTEWTTWLTGSEPDGRKAMRRLCATLGLQRDESSLTRLSWLWYEPYAHSARIAPDVIPALRTLRDRGLRLGLICNTHVQGAVVDHHLKDAGLLEFFKVRVYSTEIGHRKPHPRPFTAAMEELGVLASETMYVGNEYRADMLGAHRAGMRTVLRHPKPSRRARRQAEYVIERIEQVLEIDDLRQSRLEMEIAKSPQPTMPAMTPALASAAR